MGTRLQNRVDHHASAGLGTVFLGASLIGVTTFGYRSGVVDPTVWLIAVGLGMYVPYIAFHVMVFERMIALFRYESNIGYLMYTADAFGYLGSSVVMLYRTFGAKQLSWLEFFVGASYAMSVGCLLLTALSVLYFRRKLLDAPAATARAAQFATQ